MRYWWVSQNQTFKHEVPGGYLWSPKENKNGSVSHYYECMREVAFGDLIFSFYHRKIMALGFARGPAYTCPKPEAFGSAGANWNRIGWKIEASFQMLRNPVEPRKHMDILERLLSKRYAPMQSSGSGNQMYITEVSKEFGQALLLLIGEEARPFIANRAAILGRTDIMESQGSDDELLKKWDTVQIDNVNKDKKLTETEKVQVIKSRRGQGLFRNRLSEIEKSCRVTHVDEPIHLRASHIKPWSVSDNEERLDGANGLFLTPSIDHLFDRGYISFQNNGGVLISPTAHRVSLLRMGIPKDEAHNVGKFTREQVKYLEYHRDVIFLKSRI